MDDCPAISLIGETSVSGALTAMDCHINVAVETGYARLFGPGGVFGYALTSLLIIYVALIAYGFMTGRTRLTVVMMSPRLMTMVLVMTFVSVWPAYHAIFYGLLMGGPDEIAAAILGERGSAVMTFAQALDGLFVKFADIARALDPSSGHVGTVQVGGVTSANPGINVIASHAMPVTLFWLSGLFLLVSTLGVLILTRLVLYLLLILGPVFIVFALFPQTRGLFNGWLRTSLIFALAPLFTVLGGTAALMLFVPLIDAIGDNPQLAVSQVQPMVILFMGSMIYCAFLLVLMWVVASVVRDWQATWKDRSVIESQAQPSPVYASRSNIADQPTFSTRVSSDAYERTQPLIAAVTRDAAQAMTTQARAESLGLYDPQARNVSTDRFTRVQGLGQRFRPPATSTIVTTTQQAKT